MLGAQILMDNIAQGELLLEWGFSAYIEYRGKRYLLDTGSTDKYLENAEKLGVKLSEADCAVLSHAHYDHSGGCRTFFSLNDHAKLYLSAACGEDCFFKLGPIRKYIGVPRGMLTDCADRLETVAGFRQLDEGVWLVPHLENGLDAIGKKAHLYRREGRRLQPDDFCHELSLVFDTDKGLVVFNSCSHGGLANILRDLEHYLPGKSIYMTVGGLHLSKYSDADVRETARTIRLLGITRIVTGHCTGDRAFKILREELGDKVEQTRVGMKIELS